MSERSAASTWVAARTHPASYPGKHPMTAFALVDDTVAELVWSAPPNLDTIDVLGCGSLPKLLNERGLPSLAERIPVLAYGGNRNPATLELKLHHYQYRSPGRGVVLPVLSASLRGLDVVAGGLSSQGYMFADLYSDTSTRDTELDVHVLLLDNDQLRVMHESEGTNQGLYDVALLDGVSLVGATAQMAVITVLAYLGTARAFISPSLGTPIALSAVQARGRRLTEFDSLGMLAHALEACELVAEVKNVVAPDSATPIDTRDVASELMRYLNGQWWYRHHTGERRVQSCERLEALIVERLMHASAVESERQMVSGVQRILSSTAALDSSSTLRLGDTLGKGM
jgi:hypothetical protein